jgi:hypothetical protein
MWYIFKLSCDVLCHRNDMPANFTAGGEERNLFYINYDSLCSDTQSSQYPLEIVPARVNKVIKST